MYVLRLLAASAILLTCGARGFAESAQYCHDYAAAAVIKAGENLAFRCGYSGVRWHTSYAVHFAWCLSADRADTIRESAFRRRMIVACHG